MQAYLLLEPEIRPNERQGDGYAKPHGQDGNQSAKGDGSRRSLHPEDEVHDEEVSKDNSAGKKTTTLRPVQAGYGVTA